MIGPDTSVHDRRMLVLRECAAIPRVAYAQGIRAVHVRYFHGRESLCQGLTLVQIEKDLRWLHREGYLDRVRPAEYRVNVVGLSRVEQLEAEQETS
jgi:hypothetical protein